MTKQMSPINHQRTNKEKLQQWNRLETVSRKTTLVGGGMGCRGGGGGGRRALNQAPRL